MLFVEVTIVTVTFLQLPAKTKSTVRSCLDSTNITGGGGEDPLYIDSSCWMFNQDVVCSRETLSRTRQTRQQAPWGRRDFHSLIVLFFRIISQILTHRLLEVVHFGWMSRNLFHFKNSLRIMRFFSFLPCEGPVMLSVLHLGTDLGAVMQNIKEKHCSKNNTET